MMGNGVKAVFVWSFPLDYDSFKEEYSAWADIAHALWYGFVQACASLLTRQLCQQALSQGFTFCLMHSPPMQLDEWNKWWWLQAVWAQQGNDLEIQ